MTTSTMPRSALDELKRQLAELDALIRQGVLSGDAARATRDRLEAEVMAQVLSPRRGGAAAAPVPAPAPSRRLVAALAVGIAAFAAGGYAWLGQPEGLSAGPGNASAQSAPAHEVAAGTIEAMTERLAQRLAGQPDDAEGFAMLGRSYTALGRRAEAVTAFRRVVALRPRDGQALADLADAVATQAGGLDGEPERLIAQALVAEPAQPKARALAATVAFNRGDMPTAIRHWQEALRSLPASSDFARQIEGAIAEAQQRSGVAAAPAAPPDAARPGVAQTQTQTQGQGQAQQQAPGQTPAPPAAGARLQGRVSIAPALASAAAPDDTVFVFARPAGGGIPLALVRRQVKELPFDFVLDDSQAMSPEARLSRASDVLVTARISKSGSAAPRPGDLQSTPLAARVGREGLQIEINDRVR